MAEPMSGLVTRCPWCSTPLPDATLDTCPGCGATLASAAGLEPQLPGVTTIDAQAILRARSEVARPRSRLFSLITGETTEASAVAGSAESVAPPSNEVRREMRRLRIEAERAELENEMALLQAQARLEGRPLPFPDEATAHVDDTPVAGPDAAADGSAVTDAEIPADRSAL